MELPYLATSDAPRRQEPPDNNQKADEKLP